MTREEFEKYAAAVGTTTREVDALIVPLYEAQPVHFAWELRRDEFRVHGWVHVTDMRQDGPDRARVLWWVREGAPPVPLASTALVVRVTFLLHLEQFVEAFLTHRERFRNDGLQGPWPLYVDAAMKQLTRAVERDTGRP